MFVNYVIFQQVFMATRSYCYLKCAKNSCSCINILVKMSSKPQQKPFNIGSSPPEVFYTKEILKTLVEKQLCRSLLFHKITGSEAVTWRCSAKKVFLKIGKIHLCQRLKLEAMGLQSFQKRLQQRCFLVNFARFPRNLIS